MTTVSPVPTAVPSTNGDRHQQLHHQEMRRPPSDEGAVPATSLPIDEPLRAIAPPTEPQAPPEGTFVASQLAERLRLLEVNLRKLATGRAPWQPPRSDLNLRDRTV